MKRIMLSAAAIMFIISGAFAGTNKKNLTTVQLSPQLNQLSHEFPGLSATLPASIEVKKNLRVITDNDNADTDEGTSPQLQMVSLSGKNFDETAFYDKNGNLTSYEEKQTDTPLPTEVTGAIHAKHPDAMITKDKEVINEKKGAEETMYKVQFKDDKKHYTAMVSSDGTIDHMHKRFLI